MESFDYLEEIRRSNHYDIALLTTFNFEIDFFEHFILNALNNNGVRKVSVFADGKQFAEALKSVTDSSLGRRYTVNPITISGAFHPKLLLLLHPQGAKLFVSSCNLTTSGFCMNNEIVNVFPYDAEHPENLKLITHAIGFFEKLAAMSEKAFSRECEKELFEEIRRLPYYGKSNANNDLYLLDNFENSILQQVSEIIPPVESVDIAVPYYDNNLSAIDEIQKLYPAAKIRLYLQNGKSQFPPSRAKDERFTVFQFLKLSLESEKGNDRFYHGKVFRFQTEQASYILYGSANCTGAALCRSFSNGGNIECDILEIGERGEFDPFFSGFVEDNSTFSCEGMQVESLKSTNFSFRYGVFEQSLVLLTFGVKKRPAALRIIIEGVDYPYSWADDEVRVTILADQYTITADVFDAVFVTDDDKESVRCWVLFKDVLSLFRAADAGEGVLSFHIDSSGDQYIQERLALLQALALSPEDIERIREAQRLVEQPEAELDTEEGEDGCGIVDYVPPPAEVLTLYKTYSKVFNIERSYSLSFHEWILRADERTGIGNNVPAKDTQDTQNTEKYQIRDEDLAFGRFVKSCCKKMLHEKFIELVEPSDYLNRTQIFFEILDKFTVYLEKVDDKEQQKVMFSTKYVADIKSKMLLILLSKIPDDSRNDDMITLVFVTIVMNHLLPAEDGAVSREVKECNRKLLSAIRSDDAFRETGYMRYVMRVVSMLEEKGVQVSPYPEIQYIDGLFGYKPMKAIKNSLRSDYGQDAVITMQDGTIHVEAKVKALKDYMMMREGALRDINNYVKNLGGINKLIVDIVPVMPSRGPDTALKINYTVATLPANSVIRTIARRSGKKESKSIRVI